MNTQEKYLNKVAKLTETGSDYAVAKMLGISTQRMSNYRTGRNHFDNEIAFKIAVLLDMNPSEVIAELQADKAKTPEKKKFWQGEYRRWKGAAVGCTLMGALIIFPSFFNEVQAAQFDINTITRTSVRNADGIYIMRSLKMMLKKVVFGLFKKLAGSQSLHLSSPQVMAA